MNAPILYVLFFILLVVYLYPIMLVVKNKNLTARQRTNFVWLVCALPIIGSFIYLFWFWNAQLAKFQKTL